MDTLSVEENHFHELAKAMDEVKDLATDDVFYEKMCDNMLRQRNRWQQSDYSVCLERNPNNDSSASNLLSFLTVDSHVVISDFDITTKTDGKGTFMAQGSLAVNSRNFTIASEQGNILLRDASLAETPSLLIEPSDLSHLMLLIAAEYYDQAPNPVNLSNMMYEYEQGDGGWKQLHNLVFGIGNIDGEASRTTWSGFNDGADESVIVCRLTEIENPDDSIAQNFLQALDSNELFSEVVALDILTQSQPIPSQDPDFEEHEMGGVALSESDTNHFFKQALGRFGLNEIVGATIYSAGSGPIGNSLYYAELCVRFLKIYHPLSSR